MPEENLNFEIDLHGEIISKDFPWTSFIPLHAKDSKGNEFIQPRGRDIVYRVISSSQGESYECDNCGKTIVYKDVRHPVWNIPYIGVHSSKSIPEPVPFCPVCEKEPETLGLPLTLNLKD